MLPNLAANYINANELLWHFALAAYGSGLFHSAYNLHNSEPVSLGRASGLNLSGYVVLPD